MRMLTCWLPEMTLRAPGVVPPMVVLLTWPDRRMPLVPLGSAAVPAELVPI